MLGFHEPLDCRSNYTGVLDLSTSKEIERGWSPHSRASSDSPPASMTSVSPTLAITQRVLAAANSPQGTRPFKAYPRDPLTLSSTHSEAYLEFRRQMLSQTKQIASQKPSAAPGGHHQHHHAQHSVAGKKRSSSPQQQPTSSGADSDDKDKDAAYWERRRKNNEAAKRSRDARRAKEDEIAIRAAFLEQENLRLKYQIAALTDETAKLRCMLYQSEHHHLTPHAPRPIYE